MGSYVLLPVPPPLRLEAPDHYFHCNYLTSLVLKYCENHCLLYAVVAPD